MASSVKPPPRAPGPGALSFGEELRRERELRDISLREIAQATKIDVRRLEELERNDFSALPGGLYNRAYVRAYCQHIGIDVEAMVNAYLLEERGQAAPDPAPLDAGMLRGRTGMRQPSGGEGPGGEASDASGSRGRRRLLVLVLAIVVLGAGAFALWLWLGRGGAPATGASSAVAGPPPEFRS